MTFFGEIFLINFGGLTLQKSDVCIDILFILWEYKLYNSQIYKLPHFYLVIWCVIPNNFLNDIFLLT